MQWMVHYGKCVRIQLPADLHQSVECHLLLLFNQHHLLVRGLMVVLWSYVHASCIRERFVFVGKVLMNVFKFSIS
jgi:hypothetical protein